MNKIILNIGHPLAEEHFTKFINFLKFNQEFNVEESESEISIKKNALTDNMVFEGPPMTFDELIDELKESERDYQKGKWVSHEEAREMIKNW